MDDKSPIGIWITDTHLSEDTIQINFSIFNQVFALCKELGIATIFHGGDVFTSRKGQPEIVLNAWKAILDIAAEKKIRIIAIAGNHDKTNYLGTASFLDPFDGHPAFSVTSPFGALICGDGNTVVHFLPYYDEKLSYTEMLNKLIEGVDTELNNILLTHIAIDGIKNNGGGLVQNEIKQEMFDRFDLVFVGHYHNRQIVGRKKNIVYTGSAYQANFGEDDKKGCVIVYDDCSYEFKELDFPEYITLEMLAEDLDKQTIKMLEKAREEGNENKFRFKIEGQLKDSQKKLLITLQQHAKVEVIKDGYSPTDIIQSKSVEIGDILSEYDEWTASRQIADPKYGRQILNSKL